MSGATKPKQRAMPKWLAPAVLGVGLLGVGLASRRASAKSAVGADIRFPVFSGDDGAAMLQAMSKTAGADIEWQRFLLATARGESGFTSNVVLGNPSLYPRGSTPSAMTEELGPSEANAARLAYERAINVGRLHGCPWPASAYVWGSGGWLGMLPANAWMAYQTTSLQCRHPWYLLHPGDHVVTGLEFGRRLTGWSTFKAAPTWLTLRVGWGNPSAMGDPKARERIAAKFGKHLDALGLNAKWMNGKVTSLPRIDVEQTWGVLMRTFDFEPGRKGA